MNSSNTSNTSNTSASAFTSFATDGPGLKSASCHLPDSNKPRKTNSTTTIKGRARYIDAEALSQTSSNESRRRDNIAQLNKILKNL